MTSSALTRFFKRPSTDALPDFEFAPTTCQPQPRKPSSLVTKIEAILLKRQLERSLCSKCRKIIHQTRQFRFEKDWKWFIIQDLSKEIFAGDCTMCSMMFNSLIDNPQLIKLQYNQLSSDWGVRVYLEKDDASQVLYIELIVVNQNTFHWSSPTSHISLENPSDPYFNNLSQHTSRLETSTDSLNTIMRIRNWLKSCSKNHMSCSQMDGLLTNTDTSILPTRLVEIISDDPLQARICHGSTLDPTTRYFTLSHCWGNFVPCRLLQGNFGLMMNSVAVKELSITFQHALKLTSKLGFRYIWIDALCIIQDSVEDWEKESAQMSSVYSNSYCNLAAAASADGSGGLFRQRDTWTFQPLCIRIGALYYQLIDSNMWEREVNNSPLLRRGWVHQERILAPRNLYFGLKQVFWECNDVSASESFPLGFPFSIQKTCPRSGLLHKIKAAAQKDSKEAAQISHYQYWYSIAKTYSNGGLTKDTDKLVAIGGLAAKFETILNDSYLAGLWANDLVYGLLWYCEDAKSSSYSQYIAPSWSWTSVKGMISWRTVKSQSSISLVRDLHAKIDYSTGNRFGQLRGGSLSLKGELFLMVIDFKIVFNFVIRGNVQIDNDGYIFLHAYLDAKLVGGVEIVEDDRYLHCLPVRSFPCKELLSYEGLVLEPTGNIGEFRRIGWFYTYVEGDAATIEAGIRYFNSNAAKSGLEYCDNGKRGYWYSIRII